MLSVYARLKCRTSLAEVGKIRSDPGACAVEADLARLVLKGVYIGWAKAPLTSGREQSMFYFEVGLSGQLEVLSVEFRLLGGCCHVQVSEMITSSGSN